MVTWSYDGIETEMKMFLGGNERVMAARKIATLLQRERDSGQRMVSTRGQWCYLGYSCCDGKPSPQSNCNHKREECATGTIQDHLFNFFV